MCACVSLLFEFVCVMYVFVLGLCCVIWCVLLFLFVLCVVDLCVLNVVVNLNCRCIVSFCLLYVYAYI